MIEDFEFSDGAIAFSGELDGDGDIEVTIYYTGPSYINKEEIPKIIEHLQNVLEESNKD